MHNRIKVPENYSCPLCPDHRDDTFVVAHYKKEIQRLG
jgi:hypothetical protein